MTGTKDMAGLVAVVTGGGRGIGEAVVRELAARGASVVAADVDAQAAERVAADCGGTYGVQALGIGVDVASTEQVRDLFATVVANLGCVTTVVNSAGIFPSMPVLETDDDTWNQVIDVNLTGTFLVCREAARLMVGAGEAAIVNIASGSGSMANRNYAAYSASKAGVVGFSRVLAAELAPAVRVNVVSPGPTKTEGTTRAGARMDTSPIPMARLGEVDEVAAAVAFLASPAASFITGQNLHVNGGKFMP